MVNDKQKELRCGSCLEMISEDAIGFGFCVYMNCFVWCGSLRCKHGCDIEECF